jgi:hypothetical protein
VTADPTTTHCACFYELNVSWLEWVTLDVVTLTTTSVFVVDNATNSTSISINTDNAVFTGSSTFAYTPLPTNAQGVPVTTVTLLDDQLEPSTTVV